MKRIEIIPGVKEENKQKVMQWTNVRDDKFLMQWSGPKWRFPLTIEQMQEENLYSVINNEAFVGMMQIMRIEEGNAHIGRVIIDPALTGQGIGTCALQQFTKMIIKELGFQSVSLCVYAYNLSAIKCYQKSGFSIMDKLHYEDQPDCYKMIFETPAILDMTKYKRLYYFHYFKSLFIPYVGITNDVDITEFLQWIKEKGHHHWFNQCLFQQTVTHELHGENSMKGMDESTCQYLYYAIMH